MNTINLEEFLENKKNKSIPFKPFIINLQDEAGKELLQYLINDSKINQVFDDYIEQLNELFAINNPTKIFNSNFQEEFQVYFESLQKRTPIWQQGRWIYFPWNHNLIHILEENDFFKVRTARNQNLITPEAQKKFYNSVIGIAGLSVGNSIIRNIVLQGGAKHIRLADNDLLALTNLNRIQGSIEHLGELKTKMAAKQIYELNPYTTIDIFSDGLTENNIDDFFSGPPELDIIIDEIDHFAMKFKIREEAKKRKIPVLMAADNGDNGVIDIERHDKDENIVFFHNRIGDLKYEDVIHLDKLSIGKLITKLVGPENVTPEMQDSLLEIGKKIVSWPQLGGAATLNGAAIAFCVKRILNNENLEENRSLISLDEKLIPDYHSEEKTKIRNKKTNKFNEIFGLN